MVSTTFGFTGILMMMMMMMMMIRCNRKVKGKGKRKVESELQGVSVPGAVTWTHAGGWRPTPLAVMVC